MRLNLPLLNSFPTALALAIGLVAGCAMMTGCKEAGSPSQTQPASNETPQAVGVGVVRAWTSPVERMIQLVGTTQAVDTVSVTAQATGTVSWIGFEDEDRVEAGTPLVRLDDRRAAADARAARARVERLKLRMTRVVDAFERGAANAVEIDDARTALAEAEAELERYEAILADFEITAPFGGLITRRLVSLGALVSPGASVAMLNTVDPIEVRFAVPEAYLADLEPGLTIRAMSAAYEDRVFRGELDAVGAEIDPTSRAAEVYARLPNGDGLLRPGMFMTVRLVLGSRENAVLVPESALVVEGTRTEVFLVGENNEVSRNRVRIGARFPGLVEVLEGVRAGDTVVTSGVQKLRDGTLVETAPDDNLEALGVIAGRPLSEQPTVKASRWGRERDPADPAASGMGEDG